MSNWIEKNIEPDIANHLFNMRLTLVNKQVYQRNVVPDLSVDFEMLEQQLEETPQMIAFWNQVLADQTCIVEAMDRSIKTKRGQIWEKTISEAQSRSLDVRTTDIKEIVNADKSISALELELIREHRKEAKIKAVVDGLIKKFDALRSLSGFKRAEQSRPSSV